MGVPPVGHLDAVTRAGLVADVFEVGLYGAGRQAGRGGDLFVRLAFGDEDDDLAFALAEFVGLLQGAPPLPRSLGRLWYTKKACG